MKFKLEVGDAERHLVEFKFNQLTGSLVIQVDQRPVYRSKRIFNEPLEEVYHFVVGEEEKSTVRIEKRRKQLFGSRNVVYVNNRLARVVEGV